MFGRLVDQSILYTSNADQIFFEKHQFSKVRYRIYFANDFVALKSNRLLNSNLVISIKSHIKRFALPFDVVFNHASSKMAFESQSTFVS